MPRNAPKSLPEQPERLPVDLGPVIEQLVQGWEHRREKGDARLAFARPRKATAVVMGKPDRLARAINAIIDNAVSFSPAGGLVEIAAAHVGDEIRIRIDDEAVVTGDVTENGDGTIFGVGVPMTTVNGNIAEHGNGDVIITSVRLGPAESASVRFGQGGTFAYYAGATKVRTSAPNQLDRWLASRVTVHLGTATYDWRLTTTDGAVIVEERGIPFREPVDGASSVCIGTSTGPGRPVVRFDDVRVAH